MWTLWVGGSEVNSHYLSWQEAQWAQMQWEDLGYDDVVLEEV